MEVASIILRTKDVDRSTAFWSDLVGLKIAQQIPGYTFLDGGSILSNEGRDHLGAHFRDPDGHYGTLTGWVDSE